MDLVTFLKTHTKISNDFIDDFFGLYDSNGNLIGITDFNKL